MIEKMKFLSVTGPKEDIDRVVNDYLSKYEIHLENALSELKTVKSLRPYIEINPYKDKLTKAEEFASMLGTDKNQENPTHRNRSPYGHLHASQTHHAKRRKHEAMDRQLSFPRNHNTRYSKRQQLCMPG